MSEFLSILIVGIAFVLYIIAGFQTIDYFVDGRKSLKMVTKLDYIKRFGLDVGYLLGDVLTFTWFVYSINQL